MTGLFALLLLIDLTGTWVVERVSPMGGPPMKTFYTFKADGSKLTGSVTTPMGDQPIVDGTIDGDRFTFFTVFNFRRMETTGRIDGEELKIKGGFGRPPGMGGGGPGGRPAGATFPPSPVEMTAHRATPAELEAKLKPFGDLPKVTLPALKDLPDNGLVRTPPMGWNSYNHFRLKIDDKVIRETADALVSSGMRDAGYIYLNLDDGWQDKRDSGGVLQPHAGFPDMKALTDYVHSKGLKIGIYSSPGPRTCGQFIGSYGYEELDARTWANWGFDYVKYDWCSAGRMFPESDMRAVYQKMGEALRATGRPIVYALCQYGRQNVQDWGPKVGGNVWRTTFDIRDTWESMAGIGFQQAGLETAAGPGRWNDPDMLEVGNGGMTATEYRTHFTLWAILNSPLLAGNDIRTLTPETKEILLNKDIIALNQDKLGKQASRVATQGETEVWQKPLANGDLAIALFNRSAAPATISAKLPAGNWKLRDLWSHQDIGKTHTAQWSAEVPSHGVVIVRARK